MQEWNEETLDRALDSLVDEMPGHEDLEQKIIRSINKRIRNSVLRTLAVIFAVIAVLFFIVSPLMDLAYLNPYQLNRGDDQEMLGVLRDYWETTNPYVEVFSLNVEKKGFARYELELQFADTTENLVFGPANVWCDVICGKYTNIRDADLLMTHILGQFDYDWTDQDEIISTIQKLPESARIYLSVSDTTVKSLQELRALGVEVQWLQVYQPNVEFQGGLSLSPRILYRESDYRVEMTEQQLIQTYLSHLENLLDHRPVWLQFGLSVGNTILGQPVQALTETYEDAKKLSSLMSENYCVYGQRDDILHFLENNSLDSIMIENVALW